MNLLMLTKLYPFGTGEAFIENEIKVIAENFEKIIIIACEVPANENNARSIPENVKAYRIPVKAKKKDAVKGCLRTANRNSEFVSERAMCHGIFQNIFLRYFEEKSRRIYGEIVSNDLLNEINAEPFVLYSYWFFTTARVGTLIAEQEKIKYMYTRAHRYDLYENRNKLGYLPYRKLFLKRYNDIFPCSDNGTDYIKKLYSDLSENVHTALLGTLDHGVGQGSGDGVFRIVSCSRVEPVKQVGKIIDALMALDDAETCIEWTHIGDGSEFKKLKKNVATKLVNIKVNLLGNMKNSDVMKLYHSREFDLFINVSSSEGLPVSIMEALSFGIPCVATNVGGTSEIVHDGVTGKLIPGNFSTEELALTLKRFIEGDKYGVDRGKCRQYWEEHFQAIRNYRKMYDYIKTRIVHQEGIVKIQ